MAEQWIGGCPSINNSQASNIPDNQNEHLGHTSDIYADLGVIAFNHL
jgi:hypothetical protein